MEKTYKGYPVFDDIKDPGMRTWNRVSTAYNLYEDKGEEDFVGYIEQFSKNNQQMIKLTFEYLVRMREKMGADKGYEFVKKELCKNAGRLEA